MLRVAFLIPSLVAHGAERQLLELVKGLDPARHEVHVIVFYGPAAEGGDLWPEALAMPAVRWHCLHKRRGLVGNLALIPGLLRRLKALKPDLLHGYMDANLPALLAGKLLRLPVAWGIRRASADLGLLDRRSRRLLRIAAALSRRVDLVVFNSEAGLRSYAAMGFRARRMLVIPNGFDLERFRPDPSAGAAQRAAWGVAPGAPLVGLVGRLAPVKGHGVFLRAAARLSSRMPEARFVCVGGGDPACRQALQAEAAALGLGDRVLWPGPCEDMPAAYNALTALALASWDEGFPNVLGEAMACGVPCAATRAGDAERLLGDAGPTVAPGDAEGLADILFALLSEDPSARAARGEAVRARIREQFPAEALALRTGSALEALLPLPAAPPSPAGA